MTYFTLAVGKEDGAAGVWPPRVPAVKEQNVPPRDGKAVRIGIDGDYLDHDGRPMAIELLERLALQAVKDTIAALRQKRRGA